MNGGYLTEAQNPACPACPVELLFQEHPEGDSTGVAPADGTGVNPV